jgi:hypothetical protein
MRRFVYQLVDRLSDAGAGLSRNRHFALFASPAGERALRLYRHLRSLTDDLARHGGAATLDVRTHEDGVELRLEVAKLKLVRTARLSRDDLAVLARHPGPLPDALAPFLLPSGSD